MAMQMTRAFNRKFLTKMIRYEQLPGYFDEDNTWIDGKVKPRKIFGVITAGNKFSQFEEGKAVHNEDGGVRVSDFRELYIIKRFHIEIDDKVKFQDLYFNVLQQSDETIFGFDSYIIEKTENWEPS